MTTRIRELSQIPARIQYLTAIAATNAWIPNAGTQVQTILPESSFSSQFTELTDIAEYKLMRDMGKFITLVDSSGIHYATLRLVQLVDGPLTEGVPNNWDTQGQFYVSTWTANPLSNYNVTVSRTG